MLYMVVKSYKRRPNKRWMDRKTNKKWTRKGVNRKMTNNKVEWMDKTCSADPN